MPYSCPRPNHIFSALVLLLLFSCSPEKKKNEMVLYDKYCASCHIAPKIGELPKDIWDEHILPDMVSRMKIDQLYEDPNTIKLGFRPEIKLEDWISLRNYIVSLAPKSLKKIPKPKTEVISGFNVCPLEVDSQNGALYTFLKYNKGGKLWLGDIEGKLLEYDLVAKTSKVMYQGSSPITWYNKKDAMEFITEVGILDPSDLVAGKIYIKNNSDTISLAQEFHRPVHNLVEDLNSDGSLEMVVSEFGNETGQLSLLKQSDSLSFTKAVLLNQSGCVRSIAKDMDRDGKLDIVVMTSQSNESVTILYQKENLKFKAKKVLEFSPVYGSSWFELVDYNGDGFDDIITVNGDNADKSYVHKPYHGMRIHLNDGENNFSEAYFYQLYGATRVVANDFDQDGDVDFGLISTFPDYENAPEFSFVYLENTNASAFQFATKILQRPNEGRWFLMDSGDIDGDGDEDIILSSFTYVFTPVPKKLENYWAEHNTDIMVLENKLY